MNIDRKVMSEIIIILAVCIGGWMMLVEPRIRELRTIESEIEAARQHPILSQRKIIERMAGRMDDVRTRADQIERQSGFGRDSSKMYGLIMTLADSHGVTVDHLNPGTEVDAGDDELVRAATFDMQVVGSYEDVASFLSAVQEMNGFVRPVSLRLSPRGDDAAPRVGANFAFEALSFTLPPSLSKMVKADADP